MTPYVQGRMYSLCYKKQTAWQCKLNNLVIGTVYPVSTYEIPFPPPPFSSWSNPTFGSPVHTRQIQQIKEKRIDDRPHSQPASQPGRTISNRISFNKKGKCSNWKVLVQGVLSGMLIKNLIEWEVVWSTSPPPARLLPFTSLLLPRKG